MKFTQPRALAVLALAAIFGGAACNRLNPQAKAQVKAPEVRKPAPEFELRDADNRKVKLADYKGKVVLLNFWATWCPPCRIEIPWFMEFEREFKDRGFAVLGIAMDDEGWSAVRPYVQERQMNYRVLLGDEMVSQAYGGVESLPTSFVIDQDGKVAAVHIGLVSKQDYRNEILHLLDNRTAAAR